MENFLIDAQLPPSLCKLFDENGFDCIHASMFLTNNNPTDNFLNIISIKEKRIVVTKDSDFYHSFISNGTPYKLILVTTGNMRKADLIKLFSDNFSIIINAISNNNMIEVAKDKIVVLY